MWIAGVLLVIVGAAILASLPGQSRRGGVVELPWDLPGLTGPYTGVVGTLAGFSVASAIFIANLSLARESPAFAAVIGMPLISFLILVTSAMIYSSTPNRAASEQDNSVAADQPLSHLLGNISYLLGLAVGWLALPPLLEALRLPGLAHAFVWLLLVVLVVGGGRLALLTYRLTLATARACLTAALVGIALPVIYRGLVVRAVPSLWPEQDAALKLAFVAFGLAALGFGVQSGLLLAYGNASIQERLTQGGHRAALAYVGAVVACLLLAWLAVATD